MTDAIVIGAGVIGASCAFELARAGMRVVVLDRAAGPGAGSTGRATGGFRAQYGTAINIRLSLLARERLRRFRDDTGVDPGFAEVGYLWLATTTAELDALAAANALQHVAGLDEAVVIDTNEAARRNPHVELAGVIGGAFCPTDGVLRPLEILRGYLEAAARLGVEIRWNEPVVAIQHAGDRIASVTTPRGTLRSDLVVNAAGAWAAPLGRLANVDVPVVPLRRQVAITEPTAVLPASMPLTIWLDDGFHLRVREDRVLLLRPSDGDPDDPYSDRVDPAWLDDIAERTARRVPALREVPLDRPRAWAGLYEVSPDHHALLGFARGCANFLLVNGSSGHGVMHAPALALLAAQLALGVPTALDVHPLRPSRFADGDPIAGPALL